MVSISDCQPEKAPKEYENIAFSEFFGDNSPLLSLSLVLKYLALVFALCEDHYGGWFRVYG